MAESELLLKASDDHVSRLAHENDPHRALVELIWNAIDAEATRVEVELVRGDSNAIEKVVVRDDGHGIDRDELETTFGEIGNSWKRTSARTKNGVRLLHGQLGEGRLRAFALGSRVRWNSYSVDTSGVAQHITISGETGSRNVFPVAANPDERDRPASGTEFTAYNEQQKPLGQLEPRHARPHLIAQFAPALMHEKDLRISYDGVDLDPSEEILHDTLLDAEIEIDPWTKEPVAVRIIEWKTAKQRRILYGPDSQHFLFEEPGSDVEKQYLFSAYVTWQRITHENAHYLTLGELANNEMADLWQMTRDMIRAHFGERRRERRREQVVKWKDDGIYPYVGEPTNAAEQAERAVFDVVSGTLAGQISARKRDAQLTLALLRDALRHDPDNLTTIVHEVVALNEADRSSLTRLLGETTLPAIIRSANLVTARNKFLSGLEHLLFDPTDSSSVGERDHLHKILERELWIFGEGYHLMSSERSLTELLRVHLKLSELPTNDVSPVLRWDEKTGRTDLHIAARFREQGRVRHLVVELKAPSITGTRDHITQVEDYANAVVENKAFATSTSSWDFVLVVGDYDGNVTKRIKDHDEFAGLYHDPVPESGQPRVRAYVRRWRDILEENRTRLAFVTEALEHDPSIAEGLGHIQENYRDFLPASVGSAEDSEPATPTP
ncbi:MAG: ATP-binding protein [Propionibacteriales bacterium]|nr:ATP-binding protein [Propionibacteriales bacterium]